MHACTLPSPGHRIAFSSTSNMNDLFVEGKTKLHGMIQNSVNAVKAIPTVSKFLEEGTLTPDEVILSKNFLKFLLVESA